MGSVFKPKKPKADEEAKKLALQQDERIKSQESEIAAAKTAKRGNKGRASLITGAATGIPAPGGTPTKSTMG